MEIDAQRPGSRASGGASGRPILDCSFCGRTQKQVTKLIAGPSAYICDGCVALAGDVIASGEPAATPLATVVSIAADVADAACCFCGKPRPQVPGLAAAGQSRICTECLSLCREIIAEEPP